MLSMYMVGSFSNNLNFKDNNDLNMVRVLVFTSWYRRNMHIYELIKSACWFTVLGMFLYVVGHVQVAVFLGLSVRTLVL